MFKHQLVTSLDSGRFSSDGPLQQATARALGNRKDLDDVANSLAPQQEPAPVLTS